MGATEAQVREIWAANAVKESENLARFAKRVEMEGYRSALGLAATFIGFSNKKLGQQTFAVGDAVFQAYDAIEAFKQVLGRSKFLSDHVTNLASLTLSANLVGAAITLVGAFVDTGPTADEIIIEQLGKLRQQGARASRPDA